MSFGSLILVIILVMVAVWLFRAFRRARQLYRMLFYGEMPGSRRDASRSQAPRPRQTQPRGKVFSEQDGEYVDFEEIPGAGTADPHTQSYTRYRSEEQVEDAEWEDIKP